MKKKFFFLIFVFAISFLRMENAEAQCPVASFIPSDTFASCPLLIDTFTSTSTNVVAGTMYHFDFGDGATFDDTLANCAHIYSLGGTYHTFLIVTNPGGCADTSPIINIVVGGFSMGGITTSINTGCTPLSITYHILNAQGAPNFLWLFGDGTPNVVGPDSITHVYTTGGIFFPEMIPNTPCTGYPVSFDSITVHQSPSFTIGSTNSPTSCNFPYTVHFIDTLTGTPPFTFAWTFSGSACNSITTSTFISPTVTYNCYGVGSATLTVQGPFGCQHTATAINYVNILSTCPLVANAGNDATICSGATTMLSGSATGGLQPYSYSWSPTTGLSNPNIQNPIASPTSTTTYFLTVTDANSNTATDAVIVHVNSTPVVSLSLSNDSVCVGSCISVLATINAGSNYTMSWSVFPCSVPFGNPTNPTTICCNYAGNGGVSLTVASQNGCAATSALSSFLILPNTSADFNYTHNGLSYSFTDLSNGAISWLWNFGDGNTSTLQNPIHVYAVAGNYTVTLTSSNANCSSNISHVVNVNTCSIPTVTIYAYTTSFCAGTNDTLMAVDTAVNPVTYQWKRNGTNIIGAIQQIYFATLNGSYVCVVTDSCGQTATSNSIALTVHAVPHVCATVTPSFGCVPLCALLNLSCSTSGSGSFTTMDIDWGDGTVSSGLTWNPLPPCHTYSIPGMIYTIGVIIHNSYGCSDDSTFVNVVQTFSVCPPIAHAGNDIPSCVNLFPTLNGSATGGIPPYTYSWSPTTGLSNPNIANPAASPNVTTTYFLTVTDANLLSSTDSMIVIINQTPTCSFTASPNPVCINENDTMIYTGNAGASATFSWYSLGVCFCPPPLGNFEVVQFANSGIHQVSL